SGSRNGIVVAVDVEGDAAMEDGANLGRLQPIYAHAHATRHVANVAWDGRPLPLPPTHLLQPQQSTPHLLRRHQEPAQAPLQPMAPVQPMAPMQPMAQPIPPPPPGWIQLDADGNVSSRLSHDKM
ncbi:hypothetical protein ACLKA6_018423, partial [Drosophila palustris]